MPDGINHRAFYSGDVLLSHGLSPYYHRGCSVSLPCSEWERVEPLRYGHQSAMPDWRRRRFAASKPVPNSGDDVDLGKNYQLSTINCCRSADIYIQEFI